MLNNNHFVMLRSLNKEPYIINSPVLWKKRKNKWFHSIEKIDEAYDLCIELENNGLVFRREKICKECGENHDTLIKNGDFYFSIKGDIEFVLTRKGDLFINKINQNVKTKKEIKSKDDTSKNKIKKMLYKISKYLHVL